METPTIDGNKKKIKIVNALNKPKIPMGEFTILDEPVVAVIESKKPAVAAERNIDNKKNIDI